MSREVRRGLAWVAVILIFAAAVYAGYKEIRKVDQLATTIQSGLIDSCEVNGNSARKIKRAELREEVLESHALPPTYFPGIPPDVFHALIKERNEKRWKRYRESAPIDCVKQYTEPTPRP